jgi:hypothetical protein
MSLKSGDYEENELDMGSEDEEGVDDNADGEEDDEEGEEEDVEVQCDRCDAWHKLPSWILLADLPEKWFCENAIWTWEPSGCKSAAEEGAASRAVPPSE